jgi:hypothetical protein
LTLSQAVPGIRIYLLEEKEEQSSSRRHERRKHKYPVIRKAQAKKRVSFLPPPLFPPTGGGRSLEKQVAAQNPAAVDSLYAGLQPFPAKPSANPLKALEAKRS